MIKYLSVLICMLIILVGSGLYVYSEIVEVKDYINFCKSNGYDGIRYVHVNILKEEPRCANFTIDERYEMGKSKPFNEAGEKVIMAFIGDKDE